MRPYLRAANLTWGGINVEDVKEMNFTDSEVDTYRLRDGDVLLSEASGSAKEVGKPGVWRGQKTGDVCFQNTLIRVRPEAGVSSDFLYYRVLHEALRGGFVETSRGVGIHHLGAAKLAGLPVALPSTDEQERIVDLLEDRLARWEAAHAALDVLARRIRLVASRYLASELEPFQANTIPLEELLAEPLANGRSVITREGGFPVLRLTALRGGTVDFEQHKPGDWTAAEANPWLVQRGDFLVARGNGSISFVGRGGLVLKRPNPVAFPDTLIRDRVDQRRYDLRFLRLVWHTAMVRRQIESSARTTAGIFKVNQTHLERVQLPVPPLAVQEAIVERAEERERELGQCADQVQELAVIAHTMKLELLRQGFSGGLASPDPAHEPVELLLKRISDRRDACAALTKKRTMPGARNARNTTKEALA